ncbi:hypothetical protein [Natronincola ferrireducens]|uniref:Uncharacterized protein n=1 Tax=Natronincola ferrireducens TaxID=393762 RepID=A0A1G8YVY5_9FIRM|nr:hypothetical protein [Natronincola ferrireducens]SDK07022.1 hypothetical protein SAMN05660472_00664 [Natronincola ferrireducens]
MKIGFNKEGLTFNAKKFHPLNMGIKGYKIESNENINTVDATEILEELTLVKGKRASKLEKMKGLRGVLNKIN